MAREITFKLKRKEYRMTPVRIDRKKLYGWTEILATDDNGEPCKLVNTDQSGSYIIPRSGTGLGIISPEGMWVDRSDLITVNEDGSPAELIPSSYSTVVELRKNITPEKFLEHSITAFYELDNVPEGFAGAVGDDIYYFDYCYVQDCEGIPAFIMAGAPAKKGAPSLFMLTGFANTFEYLGLEQPGYIDDTEEDDFDDTLDFSMF